MIKKGVSKLFLTFGIISSFFAFHQKIFELSAWQKSKKRRGEPHTNNTKEEEEFVKEEEEFIHQRLQRR